MPSRGFKAGGEGRRHTLPRSFSDSWKSFIRTATWESSADLFINLPNCRCMDCMMADYPPRGGGYQRGN